MLVVGQPVQYMSLEGEEVIPRPAVVYSPNGSNYDCVVFRPAGPNQDVYDCAESEGGEAGTIKPV